MAAFLRAVPLVCLASAALSGLGGCLLYHDKDDDDFTPDAAPLPDARLVDAVPVDAPTDAPVDAGIDSPLAAPVFEILTPADNTLVTHHELVPITGRVTGNPVAGFDLTVDGQAAPGLLQVSGLPVGGDCYAGCNLTFNWDADAMREGTHTAQITARDDTGLTSADSVMIRFEDAPQITFLRPGGGESRGATLTTVQVGIVDRGPGSISATLSIDGAVVLPATYLDCLAGCTMTHAWNTASLAAGVHTLSVTASDSVGHTTTTSQEVIIADIPYISQINVREDDGFGTLEVEVHLYDASTDQWLGCSGDEFGLANVATGDTLYNVQAWFVDANSRPLGVDQLAGRQLRVRVTEDDFAECPARPSSDDDEIADWEPISAASLVNLSTSHGDALQLTTRTGRILSR
ncbi:MAG TPA: hypothetical protein VM261_21155 [Kofleriaceae bacterium]|nr:hypothetical protein [Kofleriaceae bacterium]